MNPLAQYGFKEKSPLSRAHRAALDYDFVSCGVMLSRYQHWRLPTSVQTLCRRMPSRLESKMLPLCPECFLARRWLEKKAAACA